MSFVPNLKKTNHHSTEQALLVNNIFDVAVPFNEKVFEVFRYQYQHNAIYREWCNMMQNKPGETTSVAAIPFLPISFFKTHNVVCGDFEPETVFQSSGTTQATVSSHFVKDVSVYRKSFLKGFELFYGDIKSWCVIALLPSYLERKNSSLVMMAEELIQFSNHPLNGFYIYNFDKLYDVLSELESAGQKTLLLGVTFGLLDFAEIYSLKLHRTVVMETGGMKGRRRELTRQEVHDMLKEKTGVDNIHSEYGMTELLSQAYSRGDGKFFCPPWMKVLVRNEEDPMQISLSGRGILNIIDLANIYSCSFIATEDIGIVEEDGSFEVSGRMDNSDIRGCSLMVL